jgi:hypothetical protein
VPQLCSINVPALVFLCLWRCLLLCFVSVARLLLVCVCVCVCLGFPFVLFVLFGWAYDLLCSCISVLCFSFRLCACRLHFDWCWCFNLCWCFLACFLHAGANLAVLCSGPAALRPSANFWVAAVALRVLRGSPSALAAPLDSGARCCSHGATMQQNLLCISILAEGAIALSVTLSGGALFAS